MRVFLTGGTGTIGSAIVSALLARGDEAVVLSRRKNADDPRDGVTMVHGDPSFAGPWQEAMAGCDAVINLAGEPLDAKRWNAQFRQRIHDSRVDATRFVCEGISRLDPAQRPATLLNASGIDYYGFAEVELFDEDEVDESAPGGESYLSGLCWDWEHETTLCSTSELRVALMRTGFVLSHKGALPTMAAPFRWGVGGPLGSGRQWVSWIHIEDVARAYLHALDNPIEGPVNLVAPGNVRNVDFAKTLARVLGKRSWLRVPAFAVMARAGQLGEYVLKGRRVVPGVLDKSGFAFSYPQLEPALRDLL